MTNCAELADYEWLTGAEGAAVLGELVGGSEPLHRRATRLRRNFSATRVHLLLEQAELRERGRAKFARADELYFTRRGLEQATDEWVAAYKARRFAGREPVGDLCCGIGGDLLGLAAVAPTVGVDRDPVVGHLAAANARALGRQVTIKSCEMTPTSACDFAAWHIDPDRRPAGRRTSGLAFSSPDAATIQGWLRAAPDAAIKLAPAAEIPDGWRDACELEWISRDRQCRQLVAWHGALAEFGGARRATALAADGGVLRSIVGPPDIRPPTAESLDRFLFEPDAALLAARLTGALAQEHGLAALASGVGYLTGPAAIEDPLVACFEVEDALPLDLASLARHLRQRGIGTLEIKVRGLQHQPERLRRELRLRGDRAATLFLTKLNHKPLAIVARRIGRVNSLLPAPRSLPPSHAACV